MSNNWLTKTKIYINILIRQIVKSQNFLLRRKIMIDLNPETLPDVCKVIVRKEDWSVQLMTGDREKYPLDACFNLSPPSGKDDRMLIGSRRGAESLVIFLWTVLKKRFRLAHEDKNNLIYSCSND